MRRRLLDVRQSTIPQIIGSCAADLPTLCQYVNDAQERLILAGGSRGWWGSWYKTVFSVTQASPYITCGREIARITDLSVCGTAINIRNEFYEFLEAGIGIQPESGCNDCCNTTIETFERGTVSTMVDIPTDGSYFLRVYVEDTRDVDKRILISGTDANGKTIYNTDGVAEVTGEYITLASPFADSVSQFKSITGIQKDVTFRPIDLYAVNASTGVETLLSTFAPDEQVPVYRRYYINNFPQSCCSTGTVQVIGMAKLEFLPVRQDTDFLIIGNLPALAEEVASIWYGKMDKPELVAMSIMKEKRAIQYLNREISHYQGKTSAAIGNYVFGTAKLDKQRIGSIT